VPSETIKRFHASRAYEVIGRFGWSVKGLIFIFMGFLALRILSGEASEEDADAQGVISLISDEPGGEVMLWGLAVGMVAYGLWRLMVGAFDTEEYGRGLKALGTRGAFVAVGIFYNFLAISLATRLIGGSPDPSSDEDVSLWIARVLELPAGPVLVTIAALITLGVAIGQIYQGVKAPYEDHWDEDKMSAISRKVGKPISRIGMLARAVAFGAVAFFLFRAGFEESPDEARDLGETVSALAEEPALLVTVAIGFIFYALHCLLNARYRRIRASQDD
jgi:hypothetical protein